MFIYAGIDEAGYGPMLGPLCIGCAAFVIPDHDPDQHGRIDLWKRLGRAVCKKKSDRRKRIAIDDSKHLKGANNGPTHPLLHLERGVLAFVATGRTDAPAGKGTYEPGAPATAPFGIRTLDRATAPLATGGARGSSGPPGSPRSSLPASDTDLFARLGVTLPDEPWYASTTPLPVANHADQLRIAASRLHRALSDEGVELCMRSIGCEAVDAAAFNREVDQTGTKAAVNFAAAMRHVESIWRAYPDDHPRIIIDRHGGRTHYRQELQTAFPETFISIIAEEPAISRYRLERGGSHITISFITEAETGHLPVALASMIAKYVRELAMGRMNRYFQALAPELKPTAGYVQDARRYLADLEPVLAARRIDPSCLIRSC